MADSTIDGLDTLASVDRTTDKLPIWDASDSNTKEATINSALGFTGGNPVSTTDTQTLQNKTLDNTTALTVKDNSLTIQDNSDTTKQLQLQLSGITTGTTRTLTVPDANTTLVGTDTTQTLTNKTLTSPTINTATIANPTLTTDTVSEYTSAAGVTVDGLLIKDGLLPAGNIQPLNLVSGTGSSWAWQSWTATLTNLSGGTQASRYIQIGKTVFYIFKYTLAGAGVAGSVSFTLPVTASNNYSTALAMIGQCAFGDTGTGQTNGFVRLESTTTGLLMAYSVGSTYAFGATLSSTAPHTWGNTDVIIATGSYEAA